MRKGDPQVFLLMCAHVLPRIYSQVFRFASVALAADVLWDSWDCMWCLALWGAVRELKGL